ncbi:MAG: DUF4089 domain-containing protein [Polaromonas sp.]|nr:DUF4089 domain-containing protein [Polaromonas sp.]
MHTPLADDTILAYVNTAAAMLSLPLPDGRAQRVAAHLGRTAAMAAQLDAFDLTPEDEPPGVFCPAPFPGHDEGSQP